MYENEHEFNANKLTEIKNAVLFSLLLPLLLFTIYMCITMKTK